MSPDPIADLLVLAAKLEAAGAEPGSPEHRFVVGMRAYVAGVSATLEEALDLVGARGISDARSRYHMARRAEDLAAALRLMPGASDWQRAKALAAEVSRFEGQVWPRWRGMEAPPANASDVRVLLFRARKSGPLPATAPGLRKAAARAQTG
jgi:hypothetical protein